jgi:hypothetical protein
MLFVALDMGDDNVEGAPGPPSTFAALIVLVLRGTWHHRGRSPLMAEDGLLVLYVVGIPEMAQRSMSVSAPSQWSWSSYTSSTVKLWVGATLCRSTAVFVTFPLPF